MWLLLKLAVPLFRAISMPEVRISPPVSNSLYFSDYASVLEASHKSVRLYSDCRTKPDID